MKKILHVWSHEKPTRFNFNLLTHLGWEVKTGDAYYDIWQASVVVGNEITGNPELWYELSCKFQGLLVYNLDSADISDGQVYNMIRSDVVTVRREDTKLWVREATDLPPDQVLVIPDDELRFWDQIGARKSW